MRVHSLVGSSILSLIFMVSAAAQQAGLPDANDIVARMVARDAQRQSSQDGYAGMRRYILTNEHMHKHAEMTVRVTGDPDGTKHFEIVKEEGWKAAQKHVLRKMLESESETSSPEARSKTRLCPDNYEFQMVGIEPV